MMKRVSKLLLCIGLCIALVLSVCACGGVYNGADGGANAGVVDEADEPQFVIPPPPVYPERPPRPSYTADPEHPEDGGELSVYRMEAESAVHTDDGGKAVAFDDTQNLRFSPLYSGNLVTCNLSKVGYKHAFSFNSDKALSGVKLVINIAGRGNENFKLSDMIAVSVNGEQVNVKGLTVNASDCTCLDPFTSTYSIYMYFKRVTVFVTLEKGENEIVLEHTTVNGGNLDYIELETSAAITGFDNGKAWDNSTVWSVVTEPTKTAQGLLRAAKGSTVKDYTLPVLSAENGYAVEEIEAGDETIEKFSFTLKGKTYSFTDDSVVYPDDAAPFTVYRMESESAVHTDASGNAVNFADNTNLRFSTLYSGNLVTGNLSAAGTKHTFSFVSDKALSNVKLVINIAGAQNKNLVFGDMMAVRVNGKSVDLTGLTLNYADCTCLDPFSGYGQYMYFKRIAVSVTLEKGNNEIVLEHLTTDGGNLDYIELETSAVITGFDNERFWDDATVWKVTKDPTEAAKGNITCTSPGASTRTYVLPELSEDNGYKISEDGTQYYFVLKGVKYSFEKNS